VVPVSSKKSRVGAVHELFFNIPSIMKTRIRSQILSWNRSALEALELPSWNHFKITPQHPGGPLERSVQNCCEFSCSKKLANDRFSPRSNFLVRKVRSQARLH